MRRVLIKSKSCVVSVCLLSSMIHSTMVNANEIKNQNLSNPSGTTIHSNWHTVLLNSGGPYTINNAGTITVTQSSGINAQVETDVTNTGTVEVLYNSSNSGRGIQAYQATGTSSFTNSGIVKVTGSGWYNAAIMANDSNLSTIENKGSLVSTAYNRSNGISVYNGASVDKIINSGDITSTAVTNARGISIFTGSSVNEIQNTGTISSTGTDNTADILVETNSSLGALSNSQSNLTYRGKLPNSYNVIINSLNNFGKIHFTNPTGSLTFGVDPSSSNVSGIFEGVLSGISELQIDNTQGQYSQNSTLYGYLLTSDDGNSWNLQLKPFHEDTNCSLVSTINGCTKSNKDIATNVKTGMNNLSNVTDANFAHFATYDCDNFGKNGNCLSIGGRISSIENPDTETKSLVFVYGKKLSSNFRVASFLHNNRSQKTNSNFSLSDKTPLLGALLVWNKNPNGSGLRLKLGNSYQKKNLLSTRQQVGVSESAIGETILRAESIFGEVRYNKRISESFKLSPFIAMRTSNKTQQGYTETSVNNPLTYNTINIKADTLLIGTQINKSLSDTFAINTVLGLEYDTSYDASSIVPTGINGLTTVSLESDYEEKRPVIALGFDYDYDQEKKLIAKIQYNKLPYSGMSETTFYMNLQFAF
mgnify:FL=1